MSSPGSSSSGLPLPRRITSISAPPIATNSSPAIPPDSLASLFLSRRKNISLAEGVGFEPTIRFPVYTLSKRAPSTARPPLPLFGTLETSEGPMGSQPIGHARRLDQAGQT